MIPLYEEYLSMNKSLTFEEMDRIHREMREEAGQDEDALELYEELVRAAARYAAIRAGWFLLDREQRMEKDAGRSSCHDSLIVKVNQLSRYLKRQGHEAAWREVLGDEAEDPGFRKRIGDFGCYLAFVHGLHGR